MIPRLFNARLPFQDEFSKIFTMQVTNYARWSDPRLKFCKESRLQVTNFARWSDPRQNFCKIPYFQECKFARQQLCKSVNFQDRRLARWHNSKFEICKSQIYKLNLKLNKLLAISYVVNIYLGIVISNNVISCKNPACNFSAMET